MMMFFGCIIGLMFGFGLGYTYAFNRRREENEFLEDMIRRFNISPSILDHIKPRSVSTNHSRLANGDEYYRINFEVEVPRKEEENNVGF